MSIKADGGLFGVIFGAEEWEEDIGDCLQDFVYFVDVYASKVVGPRSMEGYLRMHKDKTIIDKLTPSDVAYAILMYENTVDVWDKKLRLKEPRLFESESCEEDFHEKDVTQKYHTDEGVRLKTFACGWTKEGVEYYNRLESYVKSLWENKDFRVKFSEEWNEYAKSNGKKLYNKRKRYVDDGVDESDDNNEEDIYMMPSIVGV